MNDSSLLIKSMADKCRRMFQEWDEFDPSLPAALQQKHLVWMCSKIEEHADDGSITKLNRWLGFVQAAMLANRMLDLDGLRTMFNNIKRDHGATSRDFEDLTDHLDSTNSFEFDIGGQG